jgi:penicillin-binding protein 2
VFPFRPDVLAPVRDGLWMAVNAAGTATSARIAGYDVVGKTGTAQVVSLQNKRDTFEHRDHSWFVFYAPKDHPQIAGVIFVEHGGWGATAATPIARHVLETFFAKQEGKPLPPAPAPAQRPSPASAPTKTAGGATVPPPADRPTPAASAGTL